jgi:holo-[acyl-carrier protein] synthase
VTEVGVGAIDIDRFRAMLARTPRVAGRLFTDNERAYGARATDPAPRLAARWAAKKAALEVLGSVPGAVPFHDVEVVRGPGGAPALALTGEAAARADRLGVTELRLSITHSETMAAAVVVAW